jgi:hypothetical protein
MTTSRGESSIRLTVLARAPLAPEPELVALRAVFGQDEANHGTARYRVDNDGLVRVPREAVAFLTGTGGFVVTKTAVFSVPVGMLKLHHDEAAGCSYAGCGYSGDENGDVLVPAAAVRELVAHGFKPVPPPIPGRDPRKPSPRAHSTKG